MRVDLWVTHHFSHGLDGEVQLEDAYRHRTKSHIFLAETIDEYDYLQAMQLLLGVEVHIVLVSDTSKGVNYYLKVYNQVFTTWDPKDRNRI